MDHSFGRFFGTSAEVRSLYPLFARMASSAVSVIVEGETGTGKEVLAESLHEASTRAPAPFVVFDASAVAASRIESDLFGHEPGPFGGPAEVRRGLFEQADRGTLFIDGVAELPLSLQPKLLRALERGEVRRLGSDRWMRFDVRVIAAARRPLSREVREGRFRDDLFFRLNVARVTLPPLRERFGDVSFLAHHFARAMGEPAPLGADLVARFEAYPWPGNVRELKNAVARLVALGQVSLPDAAVLLAPVRSPGPGANGQRHAAQDRAARENEPGRHALAEPKHGAGRRDDRNEKLYDGRARRGQVR
jgi:two-component system, NtrC family, response regulator HydG